MKKLLLVLVVSVLASSQMKAQSQLSDYSYVVVPETFQFLAEKDQFQLNSMTKFLFDKNGFNAFYQSELPDVNNCDGLQAEILEESNITRTSITVILKDCKGNVVFEGAPGRSKYKEYRKTYQDALRKAFESIEKLNFKQKELVINPESVSENENGEMQAETISKGVGVVPQRTFNQYSLNDSTYLLKKNNEGFTLFQESELAENGLLVIGEIFKENESYVCSIAGKNYPVEFKSNSDMVIYKDENLMKLKFQN
ncbi:MAG: hypothetical protein ACSHW7_10695 [Patiriisocius sp.]|uniref:hypothetical protein n=1 Tax=Patiriisocius sp. TaxID=2822396 RepID=UPI003EF1FFD5